MEYCLNLHIGKPKCASTFLQKEIFPFYKGTYLGKSFDFSSDNRSTHFLNGFDFNFIKQILCIDGINKININDKTKLKRSFAEKNILLSEELITSRFLFHFYNEIIRNLVDITAELDLENSFDEGLKLGLNDGIKSFLIHEYDVGRTINRLCHVVDRIPDYILVVERDFVGWIYSLFFQFKSINLSKKIVDSTYKRIDQSSFTHKTLFGMAGYAMGIELSALSKNSSFGISAFSTKRSIEKLFPFATIKVLEYRHRTSDFKDTLIDIISDFMSIDLENADSNNFDFKVNKSSDKESYKDFSMELKKKLAKCIIKNNIKEIALFV